MTKQKSNIRPELIGELFTDGKYVYRLVNCETEPHATMKCIEDSSEHEMPISEFANFVRLLPERPIVKPKKPRKPRSDKGSHKEKSPEQSLKPTPEAPQSTHKQAKVEELEEVAGNKGDNLQIHVPTGLTGDTEYKVNIAGSEASGPALRLTVMEALGKWDGRIPAFLSDYERETIQKILNAGKIKKEDNNNGRTAN